MKTGLSIFKSKVAKRIFLLFLACAMFPIAVFFYVSFTQVSSQLKEQSMTRLQNTAKTHGLNILERLTVLDAELDLIGFYLQGSSEETGGFKLSDSNIRKIKNHFTGIASINETKVVRSFIGEMHSLPDSFQTLLIRPDSLKPLVFFTPSEKDGTRVFLVKKITGSDSGSILVAGEVDQDYLWGVGRENLLPSLTDVCVMNQTRGVLYSSFAVPEQLSHSIRFDSVSIETRSLEYTSDNKDYFIGYWPMFLESMFEGPNLIVILRNEKEDVFAPLSHFKVLFPLVTLLAFWIVLLLSTISIRKSMGPLEILKAGALRLANRDFDARVNISSGDEFEELANVFNDSAANLGRQFRAMEVMSEIDRAILSSLDVREVINTALKRMNLFFACDSISFSLIRSRQPNIFETFSYLSRKSDDIIIEYLTVSPDDKQMLMAQSDFFTVEAKNRIPSFLPGASVGEVKNFLVLPLMLNNVLTGIISLGHLEIYPYSKDDLAQAKMLSHQVSTALSNAYLVEDLELLSWGALQALARTVDAKSKWTAGHSERVTELSVKIARVMGLNQKEIDELHRAAFIHDIGKIGIPSSILDKPGKLSEEEFEVIKEHPTIGAKILEPIESFTSSMPIVIQHHERFDGKGYPMGLSGEQITLGARILSVADVYDALVSNRPYRLGWVEEKVIQLITEESGKQFDPKVVEAFYSAISWSIDDIIDKSKIKNDKQ
jgi:response regulator RpfG family c-di-GMP phosphodiesterase